VRAAEAYWLGRYETFGAAIDKYFPKELEAIPSPSGQFYRGERTWFASEIEQYEPIYRYARAWKVTTEASVVATEAARLANESIDKLNKTVEAFRGQIKNDLASMKAASDRVQSEVRQMEARYLQAQHTLTTPEFERAIANAERMARALESISALSQTKLAFAVFSGSNPPTTEKPQP
jgi:transcriptional regulator with AAA-type ATPase domain